MSSFFVLLELPPDKAMRLIVEMSRGHKEARELRTGLKLLSGKFPVLGMNDFCTHACSHGLLACVKVSSLRERTSTSIDVRTNAILCCAAMLFAAILIAAIFCCALFKTTIHSGAIGITMPSPGSFTLSNGHVILSCLGGAATTAAASARAAARCSAVGSRAAKKSGELASVLLR